MMREKVTDMINYTLDNKDLIFNHARENAVRSLEQTLNEMYGIDEVSEIEFASRWLELMSEDKEVFARGWYSPPPFGLAVLSGERLNFDSLRNKEFWPTETAIDWKDGLLYAYCSPVNKESGLIGDMSVTLYFGDDEKIREHFRNCRAAVQDIFEQLEKVKDPNELYELSLEIFKNRGLHSNVISRTDDQPSNLGHTFTRLSDTEAKDKLTSEDIEQLSSSRKFLNGKAEWNFEEDMQFTIEPQLLSVSDPSLPKVTHHFVVRKTVGGFAVCNDIDALLNRFGLI